ncbi:MAG: 3-dehydroquinate synthase [Bacteroidales bacterium]
MQAGSLLTPSTLDEFMQVLRQLPGEKLFALCDNNTWHHCFPLVAGALTERPCHIHIIPAGEMYKQPETLLGILSELSQQGFQKNDLLINLGGGTVSDIGGLAAALYQRGMPYVNLPTTLLAMADAAHGGKTAVDLNGIKNNMGTIWFPTSTVVYWGFLQTLPDRELRAGYVEVLKQSLLAGKKAWKNASRRMPETLIEEPEIIYEAARFKMKIVRKDPYDRGLRQILNLGHTIGHAIESWSLQQEEGPLLHGEAIALGLMTEMRLAQDLAGLDENFANEANRILQRFIHAPIPPLSAIDDLIRLMIHDKKNRSSTIRFSLLAQPGKALTGVIAREERIRWALEATLTGIHSLS